MQDETAIKWAGRARIGISQRVVPDSFFPSDGYSFTQIVYCNGTLWWEPGGTQLQAITYLFQRRLRPELTPRLEAVSATANAQVSVQGILMPSEFVEPLGKRILIRKDESRQATRGGILLPDSSEIPTITGRVVEISVQIERDDDFPIRKYDKVLFHPKNAIPVDLEADNLLFVVPIEDVVAVFRRTKGIVATAPEKPDEKE